jgi:hypothetical protein
MNLIYNVTVSFKPTKPNGFFLNEKHKFYFATRDEAETAMQSLRMAGYEVTSLQYEDIISADDAVSRAKKYQEIMQIQRSNHVAYIPKLFYDVA